MKQHFFKKNLFLGGFCSLFLGSSMVAPKDFGRYVCNFMPDYRVDLQIMAEKETYCLFDDCEKHPGNYSLDPIKEVKHEEEKVFYKPFTYIDRSNQNNPCLLYTFFSNEDNILNSFYNTKDNHFNNKMKKNFLDKKKQAILDFKNRPYYHVNKNFFHDMYNHGIMHRPFILNHIFLKLLGSMWDNEELQGHFRHVVETCESNGDKASILRDVFKKTLSQKEYDFLINNYFLQISDVWEFYHKKDRMLFFKRNPYIERGILTLLTQMTEENKDNIERKIIHLAKNQYASFIGDIYISDGKIVMNDFVLGKDINDNDALLLYKIDDHVFWGAMDGNIIHEQHQYFPRKHSCFYDPDLQSILDSMVMVSKKFYYEKAAEEKYNNIKKILKDHFIVIEESNGDEKSKLFQEFIIDFRKKFVDLLKKNDDDWSIRNMKTGKENFFFTKPFSSDFLATFIGILLGLDKEKFKYWRGNCIYSYFDHDSDSGTNSYEIIDILEYNVRDIWENYIAKYLKEISEKVKNQEKQLKYFAQLKESLLYKRNMENYPYKGFTINMSSLNIWNYLIDDFEDIYKIIAFYQNNYKKYNEKDAASMNFLEDSIFMDLRSAFIPFFNNKVVDNNVNTIYRSLALHIMNIIRLDNVWAVMKKKNPSSYIMRHDIFNEANAIGKIKRKGIAEIDWMGVQDIQWGEKGEDVHEMVEDIKEEKIIGEGAEKCKEEYMGWITEGRMEETKDEKMEEERKEGEQKIIRVKPDTKIEQIVEKVLQNEHRTSLGEKVIPGKVRK